MARNGSGTYSRVSGTPYVNGTTISEVTVNAEMDDIATALTGSLAKDGQTTPSANLPMGTYRHTGVGAGSALTDYARMDQLQNSSPQWLGTASGTDTITATVSPTPSAYAAGQTFKFISAGANTGAATLNVSSLGAKSITKDGTTALVAGDIPSGAVVEVIYDGTRFQLISKPEYSVSAWQTKTGAYNVVAGDRLRCNTSGGGFTLTLPASPTDGDQFNVLDYAGTFATNNLLIDANGKTICGASTFNIDLNHFASAFVFCSASNEWRPA